MSEIFARVTENDGSVVGGRVELSNGEFTVTGRVATEDSNQFAVEWEDGKISLENKADYELVVATKTKEAQTIGLCQGCGSVGNLSSGQCPTCQLVARGTEKAKAEKSKTDMGLTTGPAVTDFSHSKPVAVTAAENPAQPAGWAVAPVDAEAYPGGELIEVEMEKREETAEWEDAQNRAPIDGENPAQPAGFAVPPATGGPIPGQGADGLMTAAGVKANVYAGDVTGENGLVELENETIRVTGKVIAANDTEFIVNWEDETNTVENKADYNLIIASLEEDEYLDFEDPDDDVEELDADVEDFEE